HHVLATTTEEYDMMHMVFHVYVVHNIIWQLVQEKNIDECNLLASGLDVREDRGEVANGTHVIVKGPLLLQIGHIVMGGGGGGGNG
ncbi:hypothetical protein ACJX0J_011645, partial [Zea mays]